MVMLRKQNKTRGAFNILWNHVKGFVIRVVSKFKTSKPIITSDISITKTPENLETTKSNDELQRSKKMNAFLKTTEGQQLQAQLTIQTAEQANNNGPDTKTRKSRNGITDDVPSSSVRTNSDNSKKRKQTAKPTLEDAIQRQRDFLNGFVKRD